VDDEGVEELAANLVLKPQKVLDVLIVYHASELDFGRDNAIVRPLDDQIDLVSAPFLDGVRLDPIGGPQPLALGLRLPTFTSVVPPSLPSRPT
jgi:hypothetical protein